MLKRRKSGEQRRGEIVEATLALLTEFSPDRLPTTLIAARVGVSHAALFRHFPTKSALWAAVLAEVEGRAKSAWAVAESEAAPLARVAAILKAQLAVIEATPTIPALIFSPARQAADDAIRPIHLRIMADLRTRLAAHLRAAAEAGDIRAGVAAEDAAYLLLGVVQSVVLRWSLSGRSFDLRAEGTRLLELQLHLLGGLEAPR